MPFRTTSGETQVELTQRLLHAQRGVYGAHRIVFMAVRHAKDRQNGIADVFLHQAAVGQNGRCDGSEVRIL